MKQGNVVDSSFVSFLLDITNSENVFIIFNENRLLVFFVTVIDAKRRAGTCIERTVLKNYNTNSIMQILEAQRSVKRIILL